ncbi:MAG: protein-export chaperone SecB [Rickettsiales bacterium]|jgi:preprotein translocase subunit SecB|nr:protein-export chaperone SecB [Rickettsiales bacterium]
MISEGTGAEIEIRMQYLKDLSFESPNTPAIFAGGGPKPKIDISIDLNATKLRSDTFESVIIVNVMAKGNDEVVFIAKVSYAGIFVIKNVEKSLIQDVLFVDCSTLLFPFVRRILIDIVAESNFPAIVLQPVDFTELYRAKKDSIVEGKRDDK